MKATEQYFLVVLFIMLHQILSLWMKCIHSNDLATEQYFLVVLFIMLHQMVLNFESVDEVYPLKWLSYSAVLSSGTVYHAAPNGFKFWVCGWSVSTQMT